MTKKIDKRNDEENYVNEGKHSKWVSNKHFIHNIEVHHPLSIHYKKYWKEIKRRCMEGYWFEGKWMPGPLYFYINLCKIRLNKDKHSKTKIVGRPWLRDLEWEKAYVLMEARGFSGFVDDKDVTCYNGLKNLSKVPKEEIDFLLSELPKEVFRSDGTLKKYIPAREYLRKIHSYNLGKPLFQNHASNVIDIECRGGGKDVQGDTLIYSKTGPYPIKDVKIGDEIFGADGKLTKVTDRKDFNNQLQYKVTFSDGRNIECGSGHLWTVLHRGKLKTVSLEDIKDNYYWTRSTGVKDFKYAIPISKALEFEGDNPNIDPYYLGLWLGDGNSHNTGVTTMDKEIVEHLDKVREQEGMSCLNKQNKPGNRASTYIITNGGKGGDGGYSNQLKNKLHNLKVLNNKHIPNEVLYSKVEYRLAVLQGLMDSDGYVGDKGQYEISTSYKGLKTTIPKLLGGLGIKYTTSTKDNALKIHFLTDLNVVRLPRKLKNVKKASSKYAEFNRNYVKIVDIQPTKIDHSVCIAVDNEDSLFIAGDYIVTHNSYWGANGMILHTWCMDGMYDYDEYRRGLEEKEPYMVEVMVGAIDGKYTKDLLDKTSLGMEQIIGSQEINGVFYPSPLIKKHRGSWYSGKQYIENKYEIKRGGEWQIKGSGSKIYHRTFKDDPHAGNGIRTSLGVIEEVGFFNILEEALGHMKDTTYDGDHKFGTLYMFGTGGDMEGGSSEAAMEVFFNPAANDCLCFQDVWEDNGDIGFFVPYELGLNQYKDSEGITDLVRASKSVDKKRAELSKGKTKGPLYREMQNNPRVPSEAFLIMDSNIFPVGELKEHLGWLMSNQNDAFVQGQCGELIWIPGEDGSPKITWRPDLHNKLAPCDYKMKKSEDTEGCIQIWEHPVKVDGVVPPLLYIAGTDPYDQDQAENTASLGSTFIYKCFDPNNPGINEWPVAEYTARPGRAEEHHENVRKLLAYYNARTLYENERNTLKMHFSHKNSLYLLLKQPDILKATEGSNVQRQYGIHMTKTIKNEIEIYTRDWLTKDAGNGKLNLHKIYSIPLLKELIYYNDTGNFDRVIAFMLTILHRLQNHKIRVQEVSEDRNKMDSFFARALEGKFFK